MSWYLWLRVVAVTALLIPFVQFCTRFWAERAQIGGRHLKVLESCSLGSDGRLHLVEIAGKVYALSAGAKGIQIICEVEAPEALVDLRRGEGVRGERLPLVSNLVAWLTGTMCPPRRLRRQEVAGSSWSDGERSPSRAVDILAEQVQRLRRLGCPGDEAVVAGKR
ncbi:MAG: flagellar biosynthetic protein FliO [Betaproteobacteria bacterium]